MTVNGDKTIRQGDPIGPGGDRIGQLIRSAGQREAVADDRTDRVQQNVHRVWRQTIAPRTRRFPTLRLPVWFALPVAAAAAILIAVTVGIWPGLGGQRAEFARFNVLRGEVFAFDSQAQPIGDLKNVALGAGFAVETGLKGKAALSLASGHSVRFDHATRVVLAANDELILERGAIYLDSGPGHKQESIRIKTPFGVARDIGTQFELRLLDSALRVRVREGRVELDPVPEISTRDYEVSVGSELTLDSTGKSSQQEISIYGSTWDWTSDLSPGFVLEGRTLDDFLAWISRENGWRLRYSDPAIELSAAGNVLHGSIEDLYAKQALEAVLLVTGIEYQLQDGMLTVGI